MMTFSSRIAATALISLMLAGSAYAQTPATPAAPAAAAPAAPASKMAAPAAKPHTAASLECSKEADAKGLHGKERKKFRSECKKGAAKPN